MIENDLQVNWLGSGYEYGARMEFISFSVKGIELIFFIYPTRNPDEEDAFFIQKSSNKSTIDVHTNIIQKVKSMYLIKTDENFRKKFKRSYNILKILTEEAETITIGNYCDSDKIPTPDNSYILCTMDFINLLAEHKKINNPEDLDGTPFEPLKCIMSKKELAKELLK